MTPRARQTAETVRAVAYVRVSKETESGLSLAHQEEKCRQLASLHEYTLVDVIVDDGESGKSLDRPGIRRVLALVRANRSTRSSSPSWTGSRAPSRTWPSCSSGSPPARSAGERGRSLDTATAAAAGAQHHGRVSQWEREAIGERTRDALRAERRRGERCGELAYGWSVGADGRRLTANPAEQAMMGYATDSGTPATPGGRSRRR